MRESYLPLGVAEDDSLRDGEGVVQVTQCVKLPFLLLYSHKELLDSLQCQLITGKTDRQTDGRTDRFKRKRGLMVWC